MRTHTDRAVVQGARERQRPVFLWAVALLGTSALVIIGVAEQGVPDAPSVAEAEMRDGRALLPQAPLAADADRAAAPVKLEASGPRKPAVVTARAPEPRVRTAVTHVTVVGGENPMVELGRRLFFDPAASHSKRASCASCHKPEHGFSDPALRSADDFGLTPRHSQSVVNIADTGALHWDGEFASIEALVTARTGDVRPTDGGYTAGEGRTVLQVTAVADSLDKEGFYASAFAAVYRATNPTRERVSEAIAAYVRTLVSTTSAFDRWLDGERGAISPEAERGFDLFRGRAGCAQCHTVEGRSRPTFTDGRFHNTGLMVRAGTAGKADRSAGPERADFRDGRKRISGHDMDARAFKTPSLRDVAVRAPYMHDGSLATLEAVVRYYAVECGTVRDANLDPRLTPFDAGKSSAVLEADVRDLVAFLATLTGEARPGLATTAWSQRASNMRLRFVDKAKGLPVRTLVALSPGGDVLPAAATDKAGPVYLTPDADGWLELPPFAATHVRVAFPGTDLKPTSGELVPDTCEEGVLVLASAAEPVQVGKRIRAR